MSIRSSSEAAGGDVGLRARGVREAVKRAATLSEVLSALLSNTHDI